VGTRSDITIMHKHLWYKRKVNHQRTGLSSAREPQLSRSRPSSVHAHHAPYRGQRCQRSGAVALVILQPGGRKVPDKIIAKAPTAPPSAHARQPGRSAGSERSIRVDHWNATTPIMTASVARPTSLFWLRSARAPRRRQGKTASTLPSKSMIRSLGDCRYPALVGKGGMGVGGRQCWRWLPAGVRRDADEANLSLPMRRRAQRWLRWRQW